MNDPQGRKWVGARTRGRGAVLAWCYRGLAGESISSRCCAASRWVQGHWGQPLPSCGASLQLSYSESLQRARRGSSPTQRVLITACLGICRLNFGVYASRLLRLKKESRSGNPLSFGLDVSTQEAESSSVVVVVVAPSLHLHLRLRLQPCSGCLRPHPPPHPAAPLDSTAPRRRLLAPLPTSLTATTSPPPPQPARRQP